MIAKLARIEPNGEGGSQYVSMTHTNHSLPYTVGVLAKPTLAGSMLFAFRNEAQARTYIKSQGLHSASYVLMLGDGTISAQKPAKYINLYDQNFADYWEEVTLVPVTDDDFFTYLLDFTPRTIIKLE